MNTSKKPKTCKEFVKLNDTRIIVCENTLIEGMCNKRDTHILKYKTGFCETGAHEGSAPKSYSGKARPTCSWWQRCPCDCHAFYDRLFRETGMERMPVDNSGYVVDKGGFVMPTLAERVATEPSFNGHTANPPALLENPAPDYLPPTITRPYGPTATGRTARGQLESWVKEQCDIWLVEKDGFPCTPPRISEEIGRAQGINPPSVGAIHAVFERWKLIKFAVIERKPIRFIEYTEDGIHNGLDEMKAKYKRIQKRKMSAANRGIR
ncbi:MAG TPA: hypothetical protein VIY48_18210 [Candidatus Paceibacterota bacterium]